MTEKTLAEWFKIYADKGCVNRPGPKATARKAYRQVEPHLTRDEIRALQVAGSHATTGEGRGEWDAVCARIRARLFPR